jgi:hypothetical protein
MKMGKTFAFRLAGTDVNDGKPKTSRWVARDGISVAGCTGPNARSDYDAWGNYRGYDNGQWC